LLSVSELSLVNFVIAIYIRLTFPPLTVKILLTPAEVAELADAHDSNSCAFGHVGSIPTFGT
jgi:hypothetical protein